jgi:hypothetical protein
MAALAQLTARLQAATDREDFADLEEILEIRANVINELSTAAPSAELVESLTAAHEVGEAARQSLDSVKFRTAFESVELTKLQAGFVRNLRELPDHQIDYLG